MEDLERFVGKEVSVELKPNISPSGFVDGVITVLGNGRSVFLLHNNHKFQGSFVEPELMQDYKYSWCLSDGCYTKGSIKLTKQENEMKYKSGIEEDDKVEKENYTIALEKELSTEKAQSLRLTMELQELKKNYALLQSTIAGIDCILDLAKK